VPHGGIGLRPSSLSDAVNQDLATSSSRCDEALSWLSSSQTLETLVQDGEVTLSCPGPKFEAEITDVPPVTRLTVMCQRRFTLRIAPEIAIEDDFTLCLVADGSSPADCEIEASVPHIVCSTVEAAAGRERPSLALWDNTHVEVAGGNWHIKARPGRDITATSLTTANQEESLQVRVDLRLSSLDSTGDHEFDLRFPEDMTATVHEGTAAFRRALHSTRVAGAGSIKALGGLTDCSVDLSGDLEVHDGITHSEVSLDGDLEVNGTAVFGDSALLCRDAVFNGLLDANGVMSCRALDARGEVRGAAELAATSLKCAGKVAAREIIVAEDTTIGGDVNCDLLDGAGSIDVRGSASDIRQLRWKPAHGGSELAFHRAGTAIPSVTVEDGGLRGEAPTLRLSHETQVTACLIDVPLLAIVISDDSGAQRDQAQAQINVGFARTAAEIELQRGHLGLQLTDRIENLKLHVAGATKAHLSGSPSCMSELAIRGDGEVTFDSQGSTTPLRSVQIVGRTAFNCSTGIDDLAASAWAEGTPEAVDSEDNDPPRLNLDVMPTEVVDAAGGCACDGGVVPVEIVGVHPGLEPSAPVGF